MKKDFWIILIFALLFLASSGMTYMFYSQNQKTTELLNSANTTSRGLDGEKTNLIRQNQELSKWVGWYGEGTSSSTDQTLLMESMDRYKEDFPEDWNQWITENTIYAAQGATRLDAMLQFYSYMVNSRNDSIGELQSIRKTIQGDLDTKTEEIMDARTRYQTDITQVQDDFTAQVQGLRDERDRYQRDLENERAGREADNNILTGEVSTLNRNLRASDTRYAALSHRFSEQQKQLKPKIKDVEIEADGRVIYVAEDFSTVYIDLTKKHKIRPGLEFQVFRERKDGTWVLKGTIEVKKILDTMSEARIVSIRNPSNPIMAEDLIVNPIFDPEKTYHIGLIGHPTGNAKYSTEMLIYLITDSGGIYDDSVTSETDFVVLLSEPALDDRDWIRVKEFNMEVMTARQFLNLFGQE